MKGAIVSFRDISERRAARLALEESHDRLDFVLRAARGRRLGVGDRRRPHRLGRDDGGALRPAAGRRRGSLVGVRRLHPSGRPGRRQRGGRPGDRARRALRGGVPSGPRRRCDGYLAERGQVRRDEQGTVVALAGVTWDVTEQREAQEELRFTTFVVEHAADIVFWMTRAGAMRYANHTARRTLGYSARRAPRHDHPRHRPGVPAGALAGAHRRAARGRFADLRVHPPAQGRDDAAGGDHGDVRGVRRRGLRRRLLPRHHRAARRGGRAAQVQGAHRRGQPGAGARHRAGEPAGRGGGVGEQAPRASSSPT